MEAYTQTHTLSRGAPSSMRLSYFLPLQLNAPTPFDEHIARRFDCRGPSLPAHIRTFKLI